MKYSYVWNQRLLGPFIEEKFAKITEIVLSKDHKGSGKNFPDPTWLQQVPDPIDSNPQHCVPDINPKAPRIGKDADSRH
jgi:hypothetical protein